MKRFLFALICMFSFTAFADEMRVDVNGSLTKEQQAQLQLQAAQFAASNAHPKTDADQQKAAIDTAKQWVDLGNAIGAGLASTARQMGIAVNDFANTPVGHLTMMLIVWHFLGAQLVHIAFGIFLLVVLIPIWVHIYRRTWFVTTVTTYEIGKGPDNKKKIVDKRPMKSGDVGDGTQFILWASFLAIIGASLISVFTF